MQVCSWKAVDDVPEKSRGKQKSCQQWPQVRPTRLELHVFKNKPEFRLCKIQIKDAFAQIITVSVIILNGKIIYDREHKIVWQDMNSS